MTTLNEAKLLLEEHLDEGAICPCCDRFAKRYERKLNSGIAKALIQIYKTHGPIAPTAEIPWVNVEKDLIQGNPLHFARDFSIARFWKLLVPKITEEDGEKKRTSGIWRLTPLGVKFVEGRVRVKRSAHIYNDTLHDFSGTMVDIQGCLGDKFNYAELMT